MLNFNLLFLEMEAWANIYLHMIQQDSLHIKNPFLIKIHEIQVNIFDSLKPTPLSNMD